MSFRTVGLSSMARIVSPAMDPLGRPFGLRRTSRCYVDRMQMSGKGRSLLSQRKLYLGRGEVSTLPRSFPEPHHDVLGHACSDPVGSGFEQGFRRFEGPDSAGGLRSGTAFRDELAEALDNFEGDGRAVPRAVLHELRPGFNRQVDGDGPFFVREQVRFQDDLVDDGRREVHDVSKVHADKVQAAGLERAQGA